MSDDLIKRSDAIEAMEQRYQDILRVFKRKVKAGEKAIALDMIGCVKSLPSADRPRGEWQVRFPYEDTSKTRTCSNCNTTQTVNIYNGMVRFKFCPYCGARMKGADDEVLRQL